MAMPQIMTHTRKAAAFAKLPANMRIQYIGCQKEGYFPVVIPFFFAYNTLMALTKRQKEFLDFLAGFLEKRGYSPSYEEIADGLSLASLATVHKHIMALEAKNYVKRGFNQSRSLELAPKFYEEMRQHRPQTVAVEVPLLGRIAAGAPVEAIAGHDTLNFSDFSGDSSTYALQVRGESMIEDHICDGDYVLVQKAAEARDGDIVVALVDGMESTLKRFYLEPGDRVRLQPANATMQPIFVPRSSVEIQGKILAVLRKY
jgi:repressor LexA